MLKKQICVTRPQCVKSLNMKCSKMKLQCNVAIGTIAYSSSFLDDLVLSGVVVVVVSVSDVWVFTFLAVVIRYFVRACF